MVAGLLVATSKECCKDVFIELCSYLLEPNQRVNMKTNDCKNMSMDWDVG